MRLSRRSLIKPKMNPKSDDSDDEPKMFSKEREHFLFLSDDSSKEGNNISSSIYDNDFKMTTEVSDAYD